MPMRHFLATSLALASALAISACGEEEKDDAAPSAPPAHTADAGVGHAHGVGVDPADGTLYIATHNGLFRAPEGQAKATRIGDNRQDVMGFSIPEKGRLLGSGHPDPRETDKPPNLGLIESRDGGATWNNISLSGEVDFHVLRSAGEHVYGFDASSGRLLVSDDGGKSWEEREPPGPMVDLAIDPGDPEHVVASTDQALFTSSDQARTWKPLGVRESVPGLLAWQAERRLYRIDATGSVSRSDDGGERWEEGIGSVRAQPAAFAVGGDALYAALPDATTLVSNDGGAKWATRAAP